MLALARKNPLTENENQWFTRLKTKSYKKDFRRQINTVDKMRDRNRKSA